MKKTAAWILFTAFAAWNTPQALAGNHDDAQKIAVVQGFLDCNVNSTCIDERTANAATKRFLSRAAIAVLNQEKRRFQGEDDCSAVIPRCYSGLWSEPGNGGFAWNTPKFTVQGNTVSADFGQGGRRSPFQAGQGKRDRYKIDNSIQRVAWLIQQKWWR